MNTSMGEHSGETVNGQYINFYTLDGTYTVLGFENPAHMCSDTYGLPANAPGGYHVRGHPVVDQDQHRRHLPARTRRHRVGAEQRSGRVARLSEPHRRNAQWFYTHSLVGDPVIVHGAKGAPEARSCGRAATGR